MLVYRWTERKQGHCPGQLEGLGVLHFTGRKASFEAQNQGLRGKSEATPDSVSLSPACLASSPQNEAELRERVPGESDCAPPPMSDSTKAMRGQGETLPRCAREPPGQYAHLGHKSRSFQQKGGLARQKQGEPSPEQPRGNVTGLVGRESPSEPARKPRQDWAQGKSRVAGVLGYGDSKETEALRRSC